MRKQLTKTIAVSACLLLLSGCSGMNSTQQRTLSGAAIGAGVGTATTVMTGGCVSCGAAVGGVAGAAGGYVYDQYQKDRGR